MIPGNPPMSASNQRNDSLILLLLNLAASLSIPMKMSAIKVARRIQYVRITRNPSEPKSVFRKLQLFCEDIYM
jgi:hypothetical protein